jgi:hypothetical protein
VGLGFRCGEGVVDETSNSILRIAYETLERVFFKPDFELSRGDKSLVLTGFD